MAVAVSVAVAVGVTEAVAVGVSVPASVGETAATGRGVVVGPQDVILPAMITSNRSAAIVRLSLPCPFLVRFCLFGSCSEALIILSS